MESHVRPARPKARGASPPFHGLFPWPQWSETIMSKARTEAEAERLDRLESREAIADVVYDYARFMREKKADDIKDLFAQESFFELREGHPDKAEFTVRERLEGVENIVEHLLRVDGPQPIPLIHNLTVRVSGDKATSNCVMEGQFYGADMRVFGAYDDTFQRIDGRWVFASRTYTIFVGASSV
jgi:hypothetical protein